ncbi:MAG: hypothetical protein RL092_1186 [Bacteroidota bacterium]|jgi:hypothetical protein
MRVINSFRSIESSYNNSVITLRLFCVALLLCFIFTPASAQHSLELSTRLGMGLEGKHSIRNTDFNFGVGLCYSKHLNNRTSFVASLGRYHATLPEGYLKRMHWTEGGVGFGFHFGALPSKVEWRTQLLFSRFYSRSEVPFNEITRRLVSHWVQLGVQSSLHFAISNRWFASGGVEVFPGNSLGRSDAISVAFVQGAFLLVSTQGKKEAEQTK